MPEKKERWSEFLLKEFELLRNELDESVKEARAIERYALVTTGAIWSWVVAQTEETTIYQPLVWLPAILVLFFAFRALGLSVHVRDIGKHLAEIEQAFHLPEDLGWEQLYEKKYHGTPKRISVYVFWAGLLIATIAIPFLFR